MNTAERKSSACEDRTMERSRGWCRGFGWHKKQGRRRSITLTALPAPDIEIGLRHPVNYSLARNRADECDPFHNRYKKIAANSPTRGLRRHSASRDFTKAGYLTGLPGLLSSGGCGCASPIVPGGRSLLVCLVSTRGIVAANAAMIAAAT